MKKTLLLFFVLMTFFSLSALSQSIIVKDENYNIKLRIEGNIVKDGNYNIIGRIDGSVLKDGNYNIIARIDGNVIKDANYNIVARIDGSPRSIQLITILYFFVI
jgi:hypothetical protein